MSATLKDVDARSRLAGTNNLEILLFTVGADPGSSREEVYGINVFKVREVLRTPPITRVPDMPPNIAGMVSLRGSLVPVIDLARYLNIPAPSARGLMIVTEYNGHTQGFTVQAVHTILRLAWSTMRVPPDMVLRDNSGLVTAITELPDGRLVMMLDVERIFADTAPAADDNLYAGIGQEVPSGRTILYADDSSVARRQISRTLDALKVGYHAAVNGKQAWTELQRIANHAAATGTTVRDHLQLVLTDVEMPEMDGYMLTRCVKSDARFAGIPVILHSSLSGNSNRALGLSVGADEYVPKFEPARLADTLSRMLA